MGFFEVFANVLAWFYALVPSYGLAIILLTLTTRVLLLPLSIKSTRSMREMQVIQPEIKRLQKKYKGDRQKLNTEMMALYKEHGVNPFGGCAPLLLQMPVFIALYQVISHSVDYLENSGTALFVDLQNKALEVHQFLGLRLDCSATATLGGESSEIVPGTPCSGGGILPSLPYLALILFMGGTTYYQQRQMMASRGAPTDPQQQQMQTFAKIMPFVLVVIGIGFPSGVVFYWLTTNVWTIVQQRIMLRAAPPKPETAAADGKGAGGKNGAKAKAKAIETKATSKGGSKSDGSATKKGQLKSGPKQPGRKASDKKAPTGSSPNSKGGNRKKKR
ncbi:MAG: YidC/Oxa1 family membrane protein insertase [Actinomycetota bacterium]|nr:YidC/Oxa1 family membrane protein insertase [Actinomycetota bacterium]